MAASGGGGGTAIHPPAGTYGGGKFAWPVPGGYISQYFHYGHPALDIAAPYGSRIVAAAAGTVIFAGWKDNGGGYQVWISHGSPACTRPTTTCRRSRSSAGQRVGRGQQVGRVGQSGWRHRPALPLRGLARLPLAGSSYRVNPLSYL